MQAHVIQYLFVNMLSNSTKNSYIATWCSATFISHGFFTTTNIIGYTKIFKF